MSGPHPGSQKQPLSWEEFARLIAMALSDLLWLLPFAGNFPALLKDRAVAELHVPTRLVLLEQVPELGVLRRFGIEVTKAVTAITSSSQRGRPPACLACGSRISGKPKARRVHFKRHLSGCFAAIFSLTAARMGKSAA